MDKCTHRTVRISHLVKWMLINVKCWNNLQARWAVLKASKQFLPFKLKQVYLRFQKFFITFFQTQQWFAQYKQQILCLLVSGESSTCYDATLQLPTRLSQQHQKHYLISLAQFSTLDWFDCQNSEKLERRIASQTPQAGANAEKCPKPMQVTVDKSTIDSIKP